MTAGPSFEVNTAPDRKLHPKISLVIPVFREELNLPRLFSTLADLENSCCDVAFEYIMVNDGSPDNSLSILQQMALTNNKIKVVDLSRNFGKEIALSAGIEFATGDAIICMDADLQHPPALIPDMISHWRAGAEVVATIRKRTDKERLVRQIGSRMFYWIMDLISEVEMVSQTTDFRLLDRKVINAMLSVKERQRIFRGIVDWLGFRKVWLEFEAPARIGGEPGYSLGKLFELAMNSMISHSSFPLRFVGYLGASISVMSGLLLIWMIFAEKLVSSRFYYTPLAMFVVGNTLLTGIILNALGLISLYIRKIYAETNHRPLFAVRETINIDNDSCRYARQP